MWSEEDSKPRRDSLRRRLLEHDRHRPVVHELDLHPRPEDACLDRNAEVAERRGEVLVQRLSRLRTRRSGERRPIPLRRVGDEGELTHDERRAADVDEGAVELPVVALEDAKPRDLAGEPIGVGPGVERARATRCITALS